MYENIVVTTPFNHNTRLFGICGQISKLFKVPAIVAIMQIGVKREDERVNARVSPV